VEYKTRSQLEVLSWPRLQAELKRLEAQARRIDRNLTQAQEKCFLDQPSMDKFDAAIAERTAWMKAHRLAQEVELDHEDEREERQRLIGRVVILRRAASYGWSRYQIVGIGTKPGILLVQRKRASDGGLQATKQRRHRDCFIT
jgi:hypothetical protein